MAIVVIGGHARNVGKTSVITGLISALPEYHWTAIKISQHVHGPDLRNAESSNANHSAISEEKKRGGDSDTSRFLAAGAARVWWVQAQPEGLAEVMPAIRQRITEAENVILESNSVLDFLQPDLYIAVLNPAIQDFKLSAQKFFDRADAFVVHESKNRREVLPSANILPESLASKLTFYIRPPEYVTLALVEFVRTRLNKKST